MQRSDLETLAQALGATAEIMGTELKQSALMTMTDDLSGHPLEDVLKALKRCRQEVGGRLTLAAIIERIQSADGIPGAEEAWALMSRPEDDTVIITGEMGEAMTIARPLLAEGDRIAARMAFKDAYTRIVANAREKKIKPKWFVSMGHDPRGRSQPIAEAVREGKIGLDHALGLLGPLAKVEVLQLTGNNDHPLLLEHKQAQIEEQAPLDTKNGMKRIAEIRRMLAMEKTK